MDQDAFNPYKGYSEEKLIDFLKNYKLPTVPGTKVNYSNIGYGLLGHVLSLKNDSDYETMITENIFRPLGMTHSFVMLTEERMKNQSPGYHGNQRMLESWAQQQQNISQGSGAISSNMQDLLIYLKANMGITITSLISAINLTHQRTTENEGLGWNFQDIDGQEFIMKNGLNGSYASFAGFSKNTKTGVVILTNSSLLPDLIPTKIGLGLLKKLRKL
jgi:CubicO group peptidase (beta-lactamase class C family)